VFLLVLAAHPVRILLNVDVLIAGWIFPLWINAVVAIFAVLLGCLCLRTQKNKSWKAVPDY